MKTLALACLAGALTMAVPPAARAYVATSGGLSFNTGTPTPTLTITSPITLSITATGFATSLIIRGWVTGDGTQNQVTTNPSGQMLSFSQGSYSGGVSGVSLIDNLDSATPNATVNDGILSFQIYVNSGDTLTIPAQSLTFNSSAGFNLTTPTVFTGNVVLFSNNGVALSAPTSVGNVPEPSTWAMFGLGAVGAGALVLRRRQRASV